MTQTELFKHADGAVPTQSAILVDMDGTLCHREGFTDRGPHDWDRSGEDGLDHTVADIVQRFSADHTIIIFTARPAASELICRRWLKENGVPFDHIFTRKDGDFREDSIVKWEMFQENVEGFWQVRFVLDDRQRVVDMWRAKGLKCLQVASGDF